MRRCIIMLFSLLVSTVGCDDSSGGAVCGNGAIDGNEDCEAGLALAATCETEGYHGGVLACGGDCTYDFSGCQGRCGDGTVQAGEDCDGEDTGGVTCVSEGFASGTVSCQVDCTLDLSGCVNPDGCGNGVVENGEECDDTDLGGQDCVSQGFGSGTLACDALCRFDTGECVPLPLCGNAVLEDGEECDGADLGTDTCVTLGFGGGELGCSEACAFDVSGCDSPLTCGNGVIDPGESCDGVELGGATCRSAGYFTGTPTCDGECRITGCSGIVAFSSGREHTCALDQNHQAWCWGEAMSGSLGNNSEVDSSVPVAVSMPMGHGFHAISAGLDHSCALDEAGAVWCWGSNQNYQLGNNTRTDSFIPTPVDNSAGKVFVALACGDGCTCALADDGTVWCWGENSGGVLGTGTWDFSGVPVQALTPAGYVVESISGQYGENCALDDAGAAWCWGYDFNGRLGTGVNLDDSSVPIAVLMPSGRTFSAIDVGPGHVCALDDLDAAWCWGDNGYSALGDGTTTIRFQPTAVLMPPGRTFISVSAGFEHSCAVDDLGAAWCWGRNQSGALGDGTTATTSVPTPVLMPTGRSFVRIDAGDAFTCAQDDLGSLWCWGYNVWGAVGDGTTVDRTVPTRVIEP